MARDATEPRAQFDGLAHIRQLLPGGDERVPRQILAPSQAPGEGASQRVDEREVTGRHLPESLQIPGLAADNECIVVELGIRPGSRRECGMRSVPTGQDFASLNGLPCGMALTPARSPSDGERENLR